VARREAVVYGLRAVLAVARHRPEAIRRVFYPSDRRMELGELLKVTAAHRRPYREVAKEELQRLAGGLHHEGVVVVTDPLPMQDLSTLELPADALVLALDEVGNPHNLGAILRSAAWFGAHALVVPRAENQAALSPAAVRVAQGGAEVVPVAAVDDLPAALAVLSGRGLAVVGADQRARALDFSRPLRRPLCLVLGNESRGLRRGTQDACDFRISIPGEGAVESLNVSVAAGILLAAASAG
jgi:TrmH RNA methyltransferase